MLRDYSNVVRVLSSILRIFERFALNSSLPPLPTRADWILWLAAKPRKLLVNGRPRHLHGCLKCRGQ